MDQTYHGRICIPMDVWKQCIIPMMTWSDAVDFVHMSSEFNEKDAVSLFSCSRLRDYLRQWKIQHVHSKICLPPPRRKARDPHTTTMANPNLISSELRQRHMRDAVSSLPRFEHVLSESAGPLYLLLSSLKWVDWDGYWDSQVLTDKRELTPRCKYVVYRALCQFKSSKMNKRIVSGHHSYIERLVTSLVRVALRSEHTDLLQLLLALPLDSQCVSVTVSADDLVAVGCNTISLSNVQTLVWHNRLNFVHTTNRVRCLLFPLLANRDWRSADLVISNAESRKFYASTLFEACKVDFEIPASFLCRIARLLLNSHLFTTFLAHLSRYSHRFADSELQQYLAKHVSDYNPNGQYPYKESNWSSYSSFTPHVLISEYINDVHLWESRHNRLSLIDITNGGVEPFSLLPDMHSAVREMVRGAKHNVTRVFRHMRLSNVSSYDNYSLIMVCLVGAVPDVRLNFEAELESVQTKQKCVEAFSIPLQQDGSSFSQWAKQSYDVFLPKSECCIQLMSIRDFMRCLFGTIRFI